MSQTTTTCIHSVPQEERCSYCFRELALELRAKCISCTQNKHKCAHTTTHKITHNTTVDIQCYCTCNKPNWETLEQIYEEYTQDDTHFTTYDC